MEEYIKSISAINDSFRITILAFLKKYGKCCVCELEHSLDVKQSRLSTALKMLSDAGFLKVERIGKWGYYELSLKYDFQYDIIKHIEKIKIDLPEKIGRCEIKGE